MLQPQYWGLDLSDDLSDNAGWRGRIDIEVELLNAIGLTVATAL